MDDLPNVEMGRDMQRGVVDSERILEVHGVVEVRVRKGF